MFQKLKIGEDFSPIFFMFQFFFGVFCDIICVNRFTEITQ
jgi:hypothetical protein